MRLVAFLRRLFRRPPPRTPVARRGLQFDPEFVRASYRPGETFDPLNPSVVRE